MLAQKRSVKRLIWVLCQTHQNQFGKRIENKIDWVIIEIDESYDFTKTNKIMGVPSGFGADNVHENNKCYLQKVEAGGKLSMLQEE